MGITEPAIFGVNLRFFKPFIAGCIGGGCGALYASIVHLGAKGTGVTGIFGVLLCLEQPIQYIIEMAIAVGVAFVISFIIYKDTKPAGQLTEKSIEKSVEPSSAAIEKRETEESLFSPVQGEMIPLSQVSDETFAAEILGATAAIIPEDGKITAPCDGEISSIYDTGHAVCLTTKAGGELLIHIGIDTVKMEGKGFVKKVSDGDQVQAGDVLIEADLDEIRKAGYETVTMMILTNADDFAAVTKADPAQVGHESVVMTIKKG